MIIRIFKKIPKVKMGKYFQFNIILRILITSDILMISGFGLVSPIFAVFVTGQIIGGSLIVVGVADAIYLATKSILQIPVGAVIDNTKGEKIDFILTFIGSILMAICLLFYVFARVPLHIYLIQFAFGVAAALTYPAWMGLFTRNIEEGKESLLWSLHSTPSELASATTAALGGYLAEKLGFTPVFILAFAFCLLGSLFLVLIYPYIFKE